MKSDLEMNEIETHVYDEIEKRYLKIKTLHAEIQGLLETLPYKYIITRTFFKDRVAYGGVVRAGTVLYCTGFYEMLFSYKRSQTHEFKTIDSAQQFLSRIEETLPKYAKTQIERVEKRVAVA